jgi:hypothetical protein
MFHICRRNRKSNSFPRTEQKLGSEYFRQTFSRWCCTFTPAGAVIPTGVGGPAVQIGEVTTSDQVTIAIQ